MLRLRFSSGLILGLVVGLLAGVLIGMFMLPAHTMDAGAATNAQIIELTRKLEMTTEAKERTDRQLEQFQKLADQMTATFKSLEQRFTALEEAQRQGEPQRPPAGQPAARAPASELTAPAPPAAALTPVPPTPVPSTSDAAPSTTDDGGPDDSGDTG